MQEEGGLAIQEIDRAIAAAKVAPMGPFFLTDLLGLDTVLHVAEHLRETLGDRFYVHEGMKRLVERRQPGRQDREGLLRATASRARAADGDFDAGELAERFVLKAFVEACLLLEEGVATVKRHRPGDDGRRRADPAAVRPRRRDRPRRGARRAGARGERVGRALRAAADPAPARRSGPPGPEERAGLLPLSAARRRLRPGRGGQARDARRGRDRVADQPAGQLDLARGDR